MKKVTKSDILNYLLCNRLANLGVPPVEEENLIIKQGRQVNEKAREFFNASLAGKDQSLLPANRRWAKLPLSCDTASVRFDICWIDEKQKFHFIKVKSSTYSSKNIEEKINDVGAQVALLRYIKPDLSLGSASLALLNKEAKGAHDDSLFIIEDVTERAAELADSINVSDIAAVINAETPPEQKFCESCKDCSHVGECFPQFPERHAIFHIPHIRFPKTMKLFESGVFHAKDIQLDMLSDTQRIHVTAWKEGRLILDTRKINSFFSGLENGHPKAIHYLDFEVALPPIPLFEHCSPYMRIPFQFSLYTRLADGDDKKCDFLHSGKDDPSLHFVKALIDALCNDEYPIVVYGPYEKSILNMLSDLYPDYASQLQAISSRFFDLLKVIREAYFHPDANGQSSIKDILPLFAPDQSYAGMPIADGLKAVDAWLLYREDNNPKLRENLIAYCQKDAIAMFDVMQGLKREVGLAG